MDDFVKAIELKKTPLLDLEKILFVTSDRLNDLRAAVDDLKRMNFQLGMAARFRLVVDTNIILGDLRWLVATRTDSTAKTGLMEVIEASTIELYAPPVFFSEVEEKIPLLAADQGLDEKAMLAEWQIYKGRISLCIPDPELVASLQDSVDPDDAEYIALEKTIKADGVLSKDSHISMMGGNQVSLDFIFHLRNYSRTTAVEMNIKVGGARFAVGSLAVVRGGTAVVQSLLKNLKAAPDWVKLALFVGTLVVLVNPNSRAKLASILQTVFSNVAAATPSVICFVSTAAAMAQQNKLQASAHLNNALRELAKD